MGIHHDPLEAPAFRLNGTPIYVIDDDPGVRMSLADLIRALGFEAEAFAQGDAFLDGLAKLRPGIVLIDIELGAANGLDLLRELRGRDCLWPTAIITAHGAIPLAVQAVRQGAFDFLEKPFTSARLREVIEAGVALLPDADERSRRRHQARRLLNSLSERQRQVFDGVLSGLTAKQIAQARGLSHRTVEAYRLDMMAKLGAETTADLFRIRADLGEREPADAVAVMPDAADSD